MIGGRGWVPTLVQGNSPTKYAGLLTEYDDLAIDNVSSVGQASKTLGQNKNRHKLAEKLTQKGYGGLSLHKIGSQEFNQWDKAH